MSTDRPSWPVSISTIVSGALLCFVLASAPAQVPSSFRASCHFTRTPLADLKVNLDDYKRVVGPAPLPTRAYMITTKAAQENGRTAHAVEQVRRHLGITDIQFVYGRADFRDEDFGCDTGSGSDTIFASGYNCRMGLNWAMHQIWKEIAAVGSPAFFMEDDVIFHDDTAALLPRYWKQVPPDYEIVYFGSAPAWLLVKGQSSPPPEPVRFGSAPYALHCIALTAVSATRFAALYTQIFRSRGWRAELGMPEIGASEVFGDLFLSSHGLRTAFDTRKWVSFESTAMEPAKWSGIVFRDEFKRTQQLEAQGCKCDNEYTPTCRGFFPIWCVGLAYQHMHCNNMTRMHSWIAHYKEDMLTSRSTSIDSAS